MSGMKAFLDHSVDAAATAAAGTLVQAYRGADDWEKSWKGWWLGARRQLERMTHDFVMENLTEFSIYIEHAVDPEKVGTAYLFGHEWARIVGGSGAYSFDALRDAEAPGVDLQGARVRLATEAGRNVGRLSVQEHDGFYALIQRWT